MPSFNQVVVMGNLGKDPDLKYAASGKAVLKFSVAVNEGKDKPTTWVDCVAFDKGAENCAKYLKKGSCVLVSGKISVNNWEDKEGNKRKSVEVLAFNVQFVSTKSSSNGGGSPSGEGRDDDIPY